MFFWVDHSEVSLLVLKTFPPTNFPVWC